MTMRVLHNLLVLSLLSSAAAQHVNGTKEGFPEKWNGYLYREAECRTKGRGFPEWLDGYFLCQISAAYGKDSDLPGQKLSHMFDALGGVASFHVSQGAEVLFSGAYYPALPHKIWSFYGADFRKSSIAWPALFSPWNATAERLWSQIPVDPHTAPIHPNVDFWKVGRNVLGTTEAATWVGMDFDIPTLTHFRKFRLVETSDIFRDPVNSPIKPLGMPTHHRTDPDGTIWGTTSAYSTEENRMYQVVFTVNAAGVRSVEGIFEFGKFDLDLCSPDNIYTGDKSALASYGHSISSTLNFIIIPITSVVFNPCTLLRSVDEEGVDDKGIRQPNFKMEVDPLVPLRFIVFHKPSRQFVTPRPLESYPPMFVSHQINAFELKNGMLAADMICYDNFDIYNRFFFVDFLTKHLFPPVAKLRRFTINLQAGSVFESNLVQQKSVAAEFPQYNHAYEGRPYNYAYLIQNPFAAGSQVVKLDVTDPSGRRNKFFAPGDNYALSEPWFVERPGAIQEDDGVLLVRALDVSTRRGVLFCVDAGSMVEISRAVAPASVPFGFHNRYFSKEELGLPPGRPISSIKGIPGMEPPPLPVIPMLPEGSNTPLVPTYITDPPATPIPTRRMPHSLVEGQGLEESVFKGGMPVPRLGGRRTIGPRTDFRFNTKTLQRNLCHLVEKLFAFGGRFCE